MAPPVESFVSKVDGGRAQAALEIHNDFARDTETLTVNCADMAGYVVVVFDDEGRMKTAMRNGVRSPYSNELAGHLLSKKVEYLFFADKEEDD